MRTLPGLIVALLVLLAGCGGGGGGSDGTPAPEPVLYALSGRISPGADSAIDSDTGDLTNTRRGSNNSTTSAQRVRNPVSLGGYVNESSDRFDFFSVDLAGGQLLNLFIAEDGRANDLDLQLRDSSGTVVAGSYGTGKLETIEVPGSGTATFLVEVYVFDGDGGATLGASNYVLSITQQGQTATRATHGMRTQAEFVPEQAMVAYHPGSEAIEPRAFGAEPLARIPGHLDLLDLSVAAKSLVTPASPDTQYADATLEARVRTLHAIKALHQRPEVRYAEPNLIRRASLLPNDEFVSQQWHYNLINLPQAWDNSTGSANVIVAVADTGVRLAHPDLAGQFDANDTNGFDFVSDPSRSLDGNGRDGNADDPGDGGFGGDSSFHGTHVAGTIAAATNNSVGVAGVGWNTRIMPLRVLGERGAGSSFDITNAVLYAAGLDNVSGQRPVRRADIINLSLGADAESTGEREAYARVVSAGVIVIAAAGNSGDSRESFPASLPGIVSVAAVGRQKQRAPYSQFNSFVDVAAPGGDQSRSGADGVLSTLSSDSGGDIRDGLGFLQGTSMAAPHVAGVVALMKAVHPALTPAQFDGLLAGGTITEDLGASGRDPQFGYGLIDANKAVREAARLAGGGALPDNPRLAVQPESLNFGATLSSATLDARNAGTGSLTVTGVSDDAAWLSISAAPTASGLGIYTATVDRNALPNGSYSATITFASTVNGDGPRADDCGGNARHGRRRQAVRPVD
jgi:serine protease